jgi:uncharacterized protein YndB with AHSA1/START domain
VTPDAAEASARSVVVERELGFPIERVWRALTQPHLIEAWLMQNDFAPAAGHRFQLRRSPRPGADVVVDCQVLALEPGRTLSYTWSAYGLESVVTWTLTPSGRGTRLRMEQSGFRPDQARAHAGARHAWPGLFDQLERVLTRADDDGAS